MKAPAALFGTVSSARLDRVGTLEERELSVVLSESTVDRSLRRWLVATAIAVAATIAIGGATRLTESGLSITEWKPVTGVVPPMSAGAWRQAYAQYQLIPEAQSVHAGITLSEFKTLYWWEWAHRLAGRVVGLVVALPFLYFWRRGWIRPGLFLRLLSLPLLVGAQGALGWYMVRSGLAERTSVSPYRLVAHLSLAMLIFGIAVWTAAALGRRDASPSPAPGPVRWTLTALTAGVVLTMMSGGFVAGLDAGRIFNEFPLMGGHVIPDGYGAISGWPNLFENPIAAQFNHRVLAVLVALSIWGVWLTSERRWPANLRRWTRLAAVIALVQGGLGVATQLLAAPVLLAMAHQLGAVALLTVLLLAGVEGSDSRT